MRRKKVVPLFEDDTHELDELVINEIMALEHQTLERMKKRRKKLSRTAEEKDENERDSHEIEVSEEQVVEESLDDDITSPVLEVEVHTQDDELFDQNEEKFISASVTYLQSKDNKDAIISRIWNRLTESEPDGFYTPEENPDAPEEEVDTPANEDSDQEDSVS